jgi:hypothetical protein
VSHQPPERVGCLPYIVSATVAWIDKSVDRPHLSSNGVGTPLTNRIGFA